MRRIALATTGSLVLLALVGWGLDLPDPVAVHFAPDGTADGFAPRTGALVLLVAVPAAVAGLVLAVTWTRRQPPQGMRWTLGLPVGLVWGLGGVILATLLPQVTVATAGEAELEPWSLVGALVLGVVVTLAASRLADLDLPPTTDLAPPSTDPRLDLPAGTTVLWTGEAPNGPVPFALALVLLLAGLVTGLVVEWWIGLLLGATAGLLATAMRFSATIGPAEVRVHGMLAGWPRVVVPVDTIARARPVEVDPMEFGGWGLRTVPGLGTTAVVTRRGPALELHRTDDTRVVISLLEAEHAAAVLTTLLSRRAAPSGPRTDGASDPASDGGS